MEDKVQFAKACTRGCSPQLGHIVFGILSLTLESKIAATTTEVEFGSKSFRLSLHLRSTQHSAGSAAVLPSVFAVQHRSLA